MSFLIKIWILNLYPPHSFIYSYKMERINGEGILLGILLNSFMVLMINVAVFNNSGTGIWNAHTGKKAKLLDILLVSKQLPRTCLYCRGKILIMYLPKFLWFTFSSCAFYNEMVTIWGFLKKVSCKLGIELNPCAYWINNIHGYSQLWGIRFLMPMECRCTRPIFQFMEICK